MGVTRALEAGTVGFFHAEIDLWEFIFDFWI
jgi:hypothetical protein